MARAKKFGTFGGVFTPSILTILGVIMYLRLPRIVGEAGLYATLGIVLVAHLISSTTGLSVASIATDKKVKTGGTYFMISRSLGLPIGGTLGLALFVGLAFSVSLYLIGFSESFLGYWGFEITKNAIRLTGSIILLFVTTVTFISTSLAIKSQYFIMTAIVLSLISIFFGSHDFVPEAPSLQPLPTAVPLVVLFGIFFPAVTGFEAGVSMSGDLEDPKKSLPVGTILAVAVGLLSYIGLTFFFAYTVDGEMLINDPQVLSKISVVPELVVAGIWGATLSSALGSILGAPRILQATAIDKITPRVFAKGVGVANEPRNAVILTFFIAEAGILIGELDVIARVVSMFFITTYGFLNLSCAIESWASSDFQPDFKIPRFVSIVGALACFIVMIQLDLAAFVGATIVLGLIYFYLKRKELVLSTGDTWASVWASLVRVGLKRLVNTQQDIRNWRPNIILFSGTDQDRSHLIRFGQAAIGKLGVLSNFHLIEKPDYANVIGRGEVFASEKEEESSGVFSRSHECRDIYEGIDIISSTFGFSGVEPNTLLMGWARHSKAPEKFTRMLRKFQEHDYNMILLHYDKTKKFGDKKNVDIWWDGKSNFASFAMTMYRFIRSGYDWQQADVRLIIHIEQANVDTQIIYKQVGRALEEMRLSAEMKVINQALDRRGLSETIQEESAKASLVLLHMPSLKKGKELSVFKQLDSLCEQIGTVAFCWASREFEPIQTGIWQELPSMTQLPTANENMQLSNVLQEISLPQKKEAAAPLEDFYLRLQNTLLRAYDEGLYQTANVNPSLLANLLQILRKYRNQLKKIVEAPQKKGEGLPIDELLELRGELLRQMIEVLGEKRMNMIGLGKEAFDKSINVVKDVKSLMVDQPNSIPLTYTAEELAEGSELLKNFPPLQRFRYRLFKKKATYSLRFKMALWGYIRSRGVRLMRRTSESLHQDSLNFYTSLQTLLSDWFQLTEHLLAAAQAPDATVDDVLKKASSITRSGDKLKKSEERRYLLYRNRLLEENWKYLGQITEQIESLQINGKISKLKTGKKDRFFIKNFQDIPESWAHNEHAFSQFALLDLHLKHFSNALQQQAYLFEKEFERGIEGSIKTLKQVLSRFSRLEKQVVNRQSIENAIPMAVSLEIPIMATTEQYIKQLRQLSAGLPEALTTLTAASLSELDYSEGKEAEVVEIAPATTVDYVLQSGFVEKMLFHASDVRKKMHEAGDVISDVLRITAFGLENTGEKTYQDAKSYQEINQLLGDEKDRLKQLVHDLEAYQVSMLKTMDRETEGLIEKLNPYHIIKIAQNLGANIRTRQRTQVFNRTSALVRQGKERVQAFGIKLLYRKSEGVLAARDFKNTRQDTGNSKIGQLVRLSAQLSPNGDVLPELPFFYRQLFLDGHTRGAELWYGRERALQQATEAIEVFKKGSTGGMVIVGEPASGKTFLSNTIATRHFEKEKIFKLPPPEKRPVKVAQFKQAMETAVGEKGSFHALFTKIPEGGVLIINDLELWWERSEEGLEIIKKLMELIDKHSHRCLFLVNLNQYAYRLINKLLPFETSFIQVVRCRPFNAEELKNILLLRHRSSQLRFRLNDQPENEVSPWKMANLFARYFDISGGNIGAALQAWVSNIQSVSDGIIEIKTPPSPSFDVLYELEPDWNIILVQLMLHKKLSADRLEQMLGMETEDLHRNILVLKRSGLIIEENGFLEVNRFFRQKVIHALNENGML